MKDALRKAVVFLLSCEARLVLKKYKPKVVLVTGSVGKTTAKDACFAVLSKSFSVRRSEKNYNGDIGVPLTILGVPNGWNNPLTWARNVIDGLLLLVLNAPYPEWLIVEVGADRPGDISESLRWLKPHVVVATRFPTVSVHVEFYDSPEQVQEEELSPLKWLEEGGVLVGNADDSLVSSAAVPDGVRRVLYGMYQPADLTAQTKPSLTGIALEVEYKDETASVMLDGVLGEPHAYAALAALALGVSSGMTLTEAAEALKGYIPPAGRMRIIAGAKGSTIIDDTYNSSPAACEEAVKALKAFGGRRIAVLGDMLELGPYSVVEHERIGEELCSLDLVVCVGVRARSFGAGAERAGMAKDAILMFDTALAAAEHLSELVGLGDTILIKGSQGMRMERITKALMEDPTQAPTLLARQDSEWLVR